MVEMVIGHNKVEYLSDLEKHLTSYRTAIIALLDNPVIFITCLKSFQLMLS